MKAHNLSINTKTKKYSIFIGPKLVSKINKILTSQKLSFSKILIASSDSRFFKIFTIDSDDK